jgi:hypothetical protein
MCSLSQWSIIIKGGVLDQRRRIKSSKKQQKRLFVVICDDSGDDILCSDTVDFTHVVVCNVVI